MAKGWKYIEPVVGLGCALLGVPPLTIVGAVNGAKLTAAVKENWDGRSLDFDALVSAMRMAALRAADRFDVDQAARDALTEADAAMADHLVSCLPTREALAALARKPDFVTAVVDHVVEKLAAHDPRFAEGAPSVAGFNARHFATEIVQSVIEATLDNNDYRQSLTSYLQIETLQGVARLADGQAEDRARDVAFQDLVLAKFAALEESHTSEASEGELRKHIIALLKLNEEKSVPALVDDLKTYVAGFDALRAKVDLIEASDNRLTNAKAAAQEALERRDLDAARYHLNEAAQIETDRASEHVRGAAQSYAARADADLLALDWQAADAAWEQAAAMLMPFDMAAGEAIVREAGDRLYDFGRIFAQTPALVASERRWRALELAAKERNDQARVAIMQIWLGIVLRVQGQRTAGSAGLALLNQAVEAYRAALTVCTRDAMPVHWVCAQVGLGNALSVQGEQLGGDAGHVLLAAAVDAYRAALTVYTQAAMPADWAMTQNDLGIALRVQGERTAGNAGLALLNQAVEAFRAALTVCTKDAIPAEWAAAQVGLGNVLRTQGERTGLDAGLALLSEAVAAYRAALTVYTQATMPVRWALTQKNIGNLLQLQDYRTGDDAGLELLSQAAEAFRAALTVFTKDTMPADWSSTQSGLGVVLANQGERLGGGAGLVLLAAAVDAHRAALTVYTRDAMSVDWANTQICLGYALSCQGERLGGDAGLVLLAAAVDAHRAALTVYTQAAMPADWAITQNNLGIVLRTQGERTGGDAGLALLSEAVDAYRAALTVWTPEHFSYYHKIARNNLADAEAAIAARRG